MALVLDGAVILIFIVTCILGYVRGFMKYLILMVGAVVSVAAALWGSAVLAEPVYERYLENDIRKAVHSAADSIDPREAVRKVLEEQGLDGQVTDDDITSAAARDGDLTEGLRATLSERGADDGVISSSVEKLSDFMDYQLPETIQSGLDKAGLPVPVPELDIDRETANDFVKKAISQGTDRAADYVITAVVKPMVVTAIRCLMFVVCYAAVALLFRVILMISGVLTMQKDLRAADRFGGLALGAVKGGLYCFLIAFLLCTLVNATNNGLTMFNSEVSDQTYLFRYFFDYFYK